MAVEVVGTNVEPAADRVPAARPRIHVRGPVKSFSPASISQRMVPSAKTSARRSRGSPRTPSGVM